MSINIAPEESSISSVSGDIIERVDDFKYLGSYIADSRKDFHTRKGMAWSACIKLQKVWTSGISDRLKVKFFRACVEPVLLYGSETWTINQQFQKRLDGCYTRLLMKAKNINWKQHATLQQIYGDLPRVSAVLAQRRARLAGNRLLEWEHLRFWAGHFDPAALATSAMPLTVLDTAARDTGLELGDLRTAMFGGT